jgi:hypothetical protein
MFTSDVLNAALETLNEIMATVPLSTSVQEPSDIREL